MTNGKNEETNPVSKEFSFFIGESGIEKTQVLAKARLFIEELARIINSGKCDDFTVERKSFDANRITFVLRKKEKKKWR